MMLCVKFSRIIEEKFILKRLNDAKWSLNGWILPLLKRKFAEKLGILYSLYKILREKCSNYNVFHVKNDDFLFS